MFKGNRGDMFWRWDYWFGQVDSRPLSIFRICFALILLKDALYHLPLIPLFYSDQGLLPRATLWQIARPNRFSLLDILYADWQITLFFLLWIGVLLCLLVGYRSRLMSILNFIMILSVHERNVFVLSGADTVFRVLSFWIMFIPLGDYYAVDAVARRWWRYQWQRDVTLLRVPSTPYTTFALPVRLIQLQFALIYLATFILKLPSSIWTDGWALHYVLQLPSIVLPTGDWVLVNAPATVLRLLTWGTLLVEGSFFPFVFAPIGQPYLRMLALAGGFCLHLGIGVLMSIANFSLVMMVGYLLFFEAGWILWLDKRGRAHPQPLEIGLPKNSTSPWWVVLAITRADEIRLQTELSPPKQIERTALAHLPLSRLWLNRGLCSQMITVGLRAWARFGWSFLPISIPHHASWMRHWQKIILSAYLVPLMVGVFWLNASQIPYHNKPLVKPNHQVFDGLQALGLWQLWDMFAPFPIVIDGWIVIPGVFEDGTTFDLLRNQPPTEEMPRIYYGWDERWKKYQLNAWQTNNAHVLTAWANYYCERYGTRPSGHRLATLEIRWRWRMSVAPDEKTPQPWRETRLSQHWCYSDYQMTNLERSQDYAQVCEPFCLPGLTKPQGE